MASSSTSPSDPASPPLLLPPPEHAPPPPLPEASPRPRTRLTVADGVRGLLRSGEALVRAVFRGNSVHPRPRLQHHLHHQQPQQQHHHHHRPADIMKRLQRETFSDVMKFKERHDQIEHILSLYKSGKGLEFLQLPIQVKIALDAVGALFLVDGNEFDQAKATLDKAGKRTGLSSRFVFESKTRGKDTIAAELSTRLGAGAHLGEAIGRPVELTRLQYNAKINKWLSMILVPFGAQCDNFLHSSSMIQDLRTQASFDGPPSFLEHHNCGAGLRIKGPKFTASIGELIFGSGGLYGGGAGSNHMTTFGQVSCKPANDVELSVSGLWQVRSLSPRFNSLGALAIPLGSLKPENPNAVATEHTEMSVKVDLHGGANVHTVESTVAVHGAPPAAHSVALMLDCELYETLKTEGWFQMERPSHGPLRWGFSLSDIPENELGWGVRVGGTAEGKTHHLQHLDLEGYLNFNLGKGARLQPGLVYAKMGEKMTPALFLRSSWFM